VPSLQSNNMYPDPPGECGTALERYLYGREIK
jgi:hypothetical protein